MAEWNKGDVVRISASFTNAAGAAADPTTVVVRWKIGSGTETAWTYGTNVEVVRDSAGTYHADITTTSTGTYYYRWEGTGSVTAAEEGLFSVVAIY